MHYLKAVKAVNSDEAQKVMTQMKKTPVNDFFSPGTGKFATTGRMVHDMYLFQVKKPAGFDRAVGLLQADCDHFRPTRRSSHCPRRAGPLIKKLMRTPGTLHKRRTCGRRTG